MRDRLIELINKDNCGGPFDCEESCKYSHLGNCYAPRLADLLLENGVTIPVRCKDCEYFTRNNGGYCEGNVGLNMTNENQYCSYGKLKEVQNETKRY